MWCSGNDGGYARALFGRISFGRESILAGKCRLTIEAALPMEPVLKGGSR